MKYSHTIMLVGILAALLAVASCGSSENKQGPVLPDTLVEITSTVLPDSPVTPNWIDSLKMAPETGMTRTDSAYLMRDRFLSDTIKNIKQQDHDEMEEARRYIKKKLSE